MALFCEEEVQVLETLYRSMINKILVNNHFTLLLISNLFDKLKNASVFTKLDLCRVYNFICI